MPSFDARSEFSHATEKPLKGKCVNQIATWKIYLCVFHAYPRITLTAKSVAWLKEHAHYMQPSTELLLYVHFRWDSGSSNVFFTRAPPGSVGNAHHYHNQHNHPLIMWEVVTPPPTLLLLFTSFSLPGRKCLAHLCCFDFFGWHHAGRRNVKLPRACAKQKKRKKKEGDSGCLFGEFPMSNVVMRGFITVDGQKAEEEEAISSGVKYNHRDVLTRISSRARCRACWCVWHLQCPLQLQIAPFQLFRMQRWLN